MNDKSYWNDLTPLPVPTAPWESDLSPRLPGTTARLEDEDATDKKNGKWLRCFRKGSSKRDACIGVTVVGIVSGIACAAYFATRELQKKKTLRVLETSATMRAIHNKGFIACGVTNQPGFAIIKEDGQWDGFEVDLCRAVAASIFGKDRFLDSSKKEPIKIVPVEAGDRFAALDDRGIDILLAMTSQTVERGLFENSTQKGYTFTTPYLINGLSFAGNPDYLPCVMSANFTLDDGVMVGENFTVDNELCDEAKVCVIDGSTHQDQVARLLEPNFPGSIVTTLTLQDYYDSFANGHCNILVGEQFDLVKEVLERNNYAGPYELGEKVFSKELISIATRENDQRFSDFVNYALQSLMAAEEQTLGLTSQGPIASSDLDTTDIFGDRYLTMAQDAHAVVGDFGALYAKHLERLVPRSEANQLNLGNTPAMIVRPMGNLESRNLPQTTISSTIEAITTRGHLIVGITESHLFARWENGDYVGIDIDYAKAVSAALFDGVVKVQFEVVSAKERFMALLNGDVDMLARTTTITPERIVKEPTTGNGYTFSAPMFHDSVRIVGPSRYVQCAENRDWTSADCADLKMCLTEGTTQYALMSERFPLSRLVLSDGPEETVESFGRGDCQVFASGVDERTKSTIQKFYSGDYVVGSIAYTRESLALVTRKEDVVFSKVVDLVVNGIIYAEENGITQETYIGMPRVDLLHPLVSDNCLRNAIRVVGNYGEIWHRHASAQGLDREDRNLLNTFPLGPTLMNDQTWNRPPPCCQIKLSVEAP